MSAAGRLPPAEFTQDFGHYVEGPRDEYGGAKPDWAAKNTASSWKKGLVTHVPKTAAVKTFSDLRPISVTPILSRLLEKLVVRKYIIPRLPPDLIADQFAYRPTGSTTSALISLINSVTQKLESCTYVRCLLTILKPLTLSIIQYFSGNFLPFPFLLQ